MNCLRNHLDTTCYIIKNELILFLMLPLTHSYDLRKTAEYVNIIAVVNTLPDATINAFL